MGYYVTMNGEVQFQRSEEARIVEGLKALNHRHDLKTGGRSPKTGDPYEDNWFAWVPSRYHEDESLVTVAGVLALLGVESEEGAEYGDGLVTLTVTYDNKNGAHDVFLDALASLGCSVDVEVRGEDGERWMWTTRVPGGDGSLHTMNARTVYDDPYPTRDGIARWSSIREAMRG